MPKPRRADLSLGHNLKIAMFHLGSGMADVLTTGVWNRIMVADLGFSATFVGLLIGLRYFLAPLGVIAGRYSDTHTVAGYRRLFWIWLGRAMMVISTLSLGYATAELVLRANADVADPTPAFLWLALIVSFLLFSLGGALSGSTFLALISDRAGEEQRGRAVGLVWTFLLLGFAAGGVIFSLLLPHEAGAGKIAFSAQSLLNLFLIAAAFFATVWFFSVLGEERWRFDFDGAAADRGGSLRLDLSLVWKNRQMRFFLFYLLLSMAFAFLQDTVLEPFAGQVFGMEAHTTNRFSAYWGATAIIASFAVLYLSRRYSAFSHKNVSQAGVFILVIAYLIFAASSLAKNRPLVQPGLLFLGIGLGAWNIGTLGLMMEMSPIGRAGAFLGFWTLCVTFARGAGVAAGGVIRDIVLFYSGQHTIAYGAVFCFGLIGLLFALLVLRQVKQRDYVQPSAAKTELAAVLSSALE